MSKINRIELDNSSFTSDIAEKITFFSYAEGGAMGEPGRVLFVTEDHSVYHSNYIYTDLTWETMERAFPALVGFTRFRSETEGWKHVHLGMGNHLFVREDHFETFSQLISDCEGPADIYVCWLEKALSMN